MFQNIYPVDKVRGELCFDGDKSISHRVVMAPLVFPCVIKAENLSYCDDVKKTLSIAEKLGVQISHRGSITILDGTSVSKEQFDKGMLTLDCGNSATTARLMSGLLASFKGSFTLVGDSSLNKRPMKRVTIPLRSMGLNIECSESGTLPIVIHSRGKTSPIYFNNKNCSAQIKSAIELASLASLGKSTVYEKVKSRDHTKRLIDYLKNFLNKNKFPEIELTIPGDPSSAAYFAASAALFPSSRVLLKNISLNPTRTVFFKTIQKMGASVKYILKSSQWEPYGDIEVRGGNLKSIDLTAKDIPGAIDEIPLIGILMTQADGISSVRGASELRYKECDRISVLIRELKHLGIQCAEFKDGFSIKGKNSDFISETVNTDGDHRMAMCFSVLGLAGKRNLIVNGSDSVSVSFPDFYKKFNNICCFFKKHNVQ